MSSQYSINYHLRSHKRDALIEFIKALLLTPFILSLHSSNEEAEKRYLEILTCLEKLIEDHRVKWAQGSPSHSRDAFFHVSKSRHLIGRRFVPPSFNDIRYILNAAQVMAIAPDLKMITFDADMTLYADGQDFNDNEMLHLILQLLDHGIYVAIVTAAGYGSSVEKYTKRLSGLLNGFNSSSLDPKKLGNFYLLGGECNYLYRYDPSQKSLVYIESTVYQNEMSSLWLQDSKQIAEFLLVAENTLRETAERINATVEIIRKERAVGCVGKDLTREQLDEFALSTKYALNSLPLKIPFCCFNGGSDCWVDIGNKLIGVLLLGNFLGTSGASSLHVGDQFLSTGNDIATRGGCCTVWITSPEETKEVLRDLIANWK